MNSLRYSKFGRDNSVKNYKGMRKRKNTETRERGFPIRAVPREIFSAFA